MELLRNKSGGFGAFISHIKQGEEDFVEVGWFEEQGKHYSGLSYPNLARVHRNGVQVPKRDILGLLLFLHAPNKDPKVKALLRRWIRKRNLSTREFMKALGRRERNLLMSVFGDPKLGITLNPTPLVDTGDWRSKTVFRVASEKRLRKG